MKGWEEGLESKGEREKEEMKVWEGEKEREEERLMWSVTKYV